MNFSIRLKTICGELDKCDSFADIGCDHGYCTQYMLQNQLCEKACISDISASSLNKAETLLSEYIKRGCLSSVCCNGLEKIDPETSQVLIAGMGGREIIDIFKNSFIPKKFILQPMKNSEEVRRFLVRAGAKITKDYTFFDGKYYDLIKGERSGEMDDYTDLEYEFGRDNILYKSLDFIDLIKQQIEKIDTYLQEEMSQEHRDNLLSKKSVLEKIKDGCV